MIVFFREYTYRPRKRLTAAETYLEGPYLGEGEGVWPNETCPFVVQLDEQQLQEAMMRLRREKVARRDRARHR